jgi:hypothetical protein
MEPTCLKIIYIRFVDVIHVGFILLFIYSFKNRKHIQYLYSAVSNL